MKTPQRSQSCFNSLTTIAIGSVIVSGLSSLIFPGIATSAYIPETLTKLGKNAYFSASSPLGYGLWKTDGTKAGTVLIKDFEQGQQKSRQQNFIRFNGKLYFSSCTLQQGCEMWQTDGTPRGTNLVKDIAPGTKGAGFQPLTILKGKLYFRACTASTGCEIWTTDGTSAGTSLLKDINPGSGNLFGVFTDKKYAFIVRNRALFQVCLPDKPCELWATDGTQAGTRSINQNLNLGGGTLATRWLDLNNVYFRACQSRETRNDCGLWKSDGTAQGTTLVKDFPGVGLSNTNSFIRYAGNLFFSAGDSVSGTELWKTNGTQAGTVLVKDINPGINDSFPTGLTIINRKLCFNAKNPTNGAELTLTNGTEAGTVLVKDINPGSADSFPLVVGKLGTKLILGVTTPEGEQLWQTDCTESGTSFVANIKPEVVVNPTRPLAVAINNSLYFTAKSSTIKGGLWKTDGTTQGTVLLKGLFFDNNGFGDGFSISYLTDVNGTLLFTVAYRATSGEPFFYELWKSDGTSGGTEKIYPL
jgi:ELWxxDGT repeat protein